MKITTQPQFSLGTKAVKTINPIQSDHCNQVNTLSAGCGRWSKFAVASLVLVACALCAVSLRAQTANFTFQQTRVTVPVGWSGTVIMTNNMGYTTNGVVPDGNGDLIIQPISVVMTNLPAGVISYSLTNMNTPATPVLFTQTSVRTNSNNTMHLWVTLTLNGTTPEGTYPLTMTASGGATNSFIFFLDVAHIWNGSTNAVLSGAGNWLDASQWSGNGTTPGPNANVIFNDAGGQSNAVYYAGGTTNLLINSVVNDNMTIGSLRFAQTNSAYQYHNLQIADNKTLTIAGSNGFATLRDFMDETASLGNQQNVMIYGINNATLVVSNQTANFALLVDNVSSTVDLSQLDNFAATVNVLGAGDPYIYPPNYWNYYSNNFAGPPRKWAPYFNLARTNIIKAAFIDAYGYTNGADREYGVYFVGTIFGNSSLSTVDTIYLGITNSIYADSVLCSGAAQRPLVAFNPIFAKTNPSALFRGTNGGRMTMFCEADGSGPGPGRGNIKGQVDFNANNGYVDMLVDKFYIGRDRPIIETGQNPNFQGYFSMGQGIIDANTVILGYRQYRGNPTNTWVYSGYCEGRLSILTNGVFKVNNSLTLGSTTETNLNGLGSAGNTEWGQVNVQNGGTLIANTILVGGPAYGSSANNFIVVSNSSTLIISNTVAGTNQLADNFSLINGSTLQMQVDGNHSGAYIFTTNLTFSSTTGNNILRIASVRNLTTTTVPLIYHKNATTGTLPTVVLPGGFVGGLQDNGANNTIDLMLISGTPKHLVWRGGDSSWDTTTLNWYDQNALVMTNFANFDIVAFDDVAGYPTTIIPTESVFPGAINMTNNSRYYTFGSGSGQIEGSGVLTKVGTGTLEVDGSAIISYAITQGLLTNSGTIGGVTVSAGAAFGNAGTVKQGGLTCSGQAFNDVSSTVNGPLIIQNGGVVTNLATIQHGTLSLLTGSFLYNGLNATLDDFGSGNVASNATLINDYGFLGGGSLNSLTVSGTLKDSGASGTPSMILTMLTITGGTGTNNTGAGTFIPGGDGIGISEVHQSLADASTYPARVLFSSGSTNIFKVDPDLGSGNNYTPGVASTLFQSGYQDYGASQGSVVQNGSTIVITNVGLTSFAAGQYFQLFENSANNGSPRPTGTATNSFPVISPVQPGPGLAWDLRYLWGANPSGNWGYIGIIAVPTNPAPVAMSIMPSNNFVTFLNYTTNGSVVKTNYATNNVVFANVNWPQDHTGWRLQSQLNNPLTIGLSNNWTDVFVSRLTNVISFTNSLSSNSCSFYRMVFP